MNTQKCIISLLATAALVVSSCQPASQPAPNIVFSEGMAIYYGQHYANKGIDADVWAMEFYTGDVSTNKKGNGKILSFSDIFTDTIYATPTFPAGLYTFDTTYVAGTIIAGRREAGYDMGGYLTTMVDGSVTAVEYFKAGTFAVSTSDTITEIVFEFKKADGRTWKSSYRGKLELYAPY